LRASERDTEINKKKREEFLEKIKDIPPDKLVFLDECGTNTAMTRIYGRATGESRAVDSAPRDKGKNITLLSSIRLSGQAVPVIIEGSLNGPTFLEYTEDHLAPHLEAEDVVIMDNLASHKVAGVKEAIESTGATIIYLPPYSPELNPIEEMWSKIKAYLRKVKARVQECLEEGIRDSFAYITHQDLVNWFTHAGYSIPR
jgi:transposase